MRLVQGEPAWLQEAGAHATSSPAALTLPVASYVGLLSLIKWRRIKRSPSTLHAFSLCCLLCSCTSRNKEGMRSSAGGEGAHLVVQVRCEQRRAAEHLLVHK